MIDFRSPVDDVPAAAATSTLAARSPLGRGLTGREDAHRVGYRQPAQFAKAFRRHHGVSPSDFRAARRMASAGLQRTARLTRDGLPVEGMSRGYAAA